MKLTHTNIWIIDSCTTEATSIENDILSSNRFFQIQKFNNYSSAFETLCNRDRNLHPRIVFLSYSSKDNNSLIEFLDQTSMHYLSFFFDAYIIMKDFNEEYLEKAFQNKMTKSWLSKSAQSIQIKKILNNYDIKIQA